MATMFRVYPTLGRGEASLSAIHTSIGEATSGGSKVVWLIDEAARMASDATRVAKKTLAAPLKDSGATSKDVEIMEVGCGTVTTMDQVASGIHGTLSKASDSHSENIEEAIRLPVRKGKASKKYCPKLMKARLLVTSNSRILGIESCHSLLEEYVPSKYKEELLQEAILDSIR